MWATMPPLTHSSKDKKNLIFKAIQSAGLNPKEFEFEGDNAEIVKSPRRSRREDFRKDSYAFIRRSGF